MSLLNLSFENKNQFRSYPFKGKSSLTSIEGVVIPDSLIVNCSITSRLGKHRVYVKQIYYNSGLLKIAVTSLIDDVTLGIFEGQASEDFTTLFLTPFTRFVSGSLTLGAVSELASLPTVLNFESTSTELEESIVFCYTPPRVTSIRDSQKNELRGYVNYGVLTNITKTSNNSTASTSFKTVNPSAVQNLADKSSALGNCRTPIIKNINGVLPSSESSDSQVNPEHRNDGNIYIAGVRPVIFYGTQGQQINWLGEWKDVAYSQNDAVTYLAIPYICIAATTLDENQNPLNTTYWEPVSGAGTVYATTEGVSLDSLCAQRSKLLPPVDVSGFTLPTLEYKDKYYSKPAMPAYDPYATQNPSVLNPNYPLSRPARMASNFNNTVVPEYYFWPQFANTEYYQNTKYWQQADS